jgi:hypothetical protein
VRGKPLIEILRIVAYGAAEFEIDRATTSAAELLSVEMERRRWAAASRTVSVQSDFAVFIVFFRAVEVVGSALKLPFSS